MRFLREYVIIFLIILFVISIEIITDNITNKSMTDINTKIEDLEKSLETEDAKDRIKTLCSSWKDEEERLAFFLEHDELEKVGVLVDNVKSNIENDNMEDVTQEIDQIKFLLQHIQQKQKLELKNIF